MQKILLFIPMYNCQKQIPRVIDKIIGLRDKTKYISEIIIIDNGSTDGSIESAKEACLSLTVPTKIFQNKENVMLGGSHKVVFNYAIGNSFDFVIVLHGDDQGDIGDIISYIENGQAEQYDSLLGSRFMRGSKLINYSRFRIFGNFIFNFFASVATCHRLSDLGSGLNMYKTQYLKDKFYMAFPNNLTFGAYLLLYGIFNNSKFKFFPISWNEQDQISNAKLFKQSAEIFVLMLRFAFCKKKLFAKKENEFSTMKYEYEILFENKKTMDKSLF
jgi:glycosyltransferase involved in cell wall biosynthesis